MSALAEFDLCAADTEAATLFAPLSQGRRGFRGVIAQVRVDPSAKGIAGDELERRLLEMGFVEGARVQILHEGFIGRDPIAVRLDDLTVALRRREASAVIVRVDADSPR